MADESEARNVPTVDRHCAACASGNLHLLASRTRIPIGWDRSNVNVVWADVFVCRACGFLMYYAVGSELPPDDGQQAP